MKESIQRSSRLRHHESSVDEYAEEEFEQPSEKLKTSSYENYEFDSYHSEGTKAL